MLLLLLTLFASQPANAGVSVAVSSPGVEIVVNPFAPEYRPPPRTGYVWVAGYYDAYGFYVPGYWAPVQVRPGFIWVPGYWVSRTYHDGYWRPVRHGDDVWMSGYYVSGRYVAPRWVPRHEADAWRRHEAAERAAARSHSHSRPESTHHSSNGHKQPKH